MIFRSHLLRFLPFLSIVFIGCQDSAPHEGAIEQLLMNSERPYVCQVQGNTKFRPHEDGTQGGVQWECESVFLDEGTNCDLVKFSAEKEPDHMVFMSRIGGAVHSISSPGLSFETDWKCEDVDIPSSRSNTIYSLGGWSLCAQAASLMRALGKGVSNVRGEELRVEWDNIPEELSEAIYSQVFYPGFPEDSQLVSVHLTVDKAKGVPLYVGFFFSSGDSFENTFSGFSFGVLDYAKESERIRSNLSAPESFSCPRGG